MTSPHSPHGKLRHAIEAVAHLVNEERELIDAGLRAIQGDEAREFARRFRQAVDDWTSASREALAASVTARRTIPRPHLAVLCREVIAAAEAADDWWLQDAGGARLVEAVAALREVDLDRSLGLGGVTLEDA